MLIGLPSQFYPFLSLIYTVIGLEQSQPIFSPPIAYGTSRSYLLFVISFRVRAVFASVLPVYKVILML
jgi:hypothetical protein